MVNGKPKSDVPSLILHLASQASLASLLCILYYNWLRWYISCQYNSIDCCLTFLSAVGTCLLGCDLLGFFFTSDGSQLQRWFWHQGVCNNYCNKAFQRETREHSRRLLGPLLLVLEKIYWPFWQVCLSLAGVLAKL